MAPRPHREPMAASAWIRGWFSTGTPHGFPASPRDGWDAAAAFVGETARARGPLDGRTKRSDTPFGATGARANRRRPNAPKPA